MKIGINCGHTVSGTTGCGAVGYIDESDETRAVGYALEQILTDMGHTVVDCTNDRASTVNGNLSAICAMANAQPLDLFVSIHFNSGGGKGAEVYTYGGKQLDCAVSVCDELHKLGFVNRGVKGSNLYVINHTNAKAILVEVCFVDSQADAKLYKELGAKKIAQAIAKAVTGQEIKNNTEELTMGQYEELNGRINKLENPMIYNYDDKNLPEWAREAVRWCVKVGIIQGTGNGLGLNDDKLWMCVVMYRMAKLWGKA